MRPENSPGHALLSIRERISSEIALVPEDRKRDDLVQIMSVDQNLSLASIGALEDSPRLGSMCLTKSTRTVSVNQNWEPCHYGYDRKKNTVQHC